MQIGADIADLNTKMDRAQGAVASGVSKINGAVAAMKATAAFGAVVGMLHEVAGAADELDTLSARIDDTVGNVQRLQAISESFDVDLQSVVAGIQVMQDKLGNDKIAPALHAIGVEIDNFKKAAPAEQFVMVAEALAKIEDPATRAAAASDIFGKNAKALAGAFRDGVGDVDRWIKMSDGAVSASDRISTFFTKAKASVVNFSAELLYSMTLLRQYDQLTSFFDKTPPQVKNLPQKFVPELPAGLPKDYESVNKSLTESAESSIKLHKAQEKVAEQTERAMEAMRESVTYVQITERGWLVIPNAVEDTADAIDEVRQSMQAMSEISFNTTWVEFKAGVKDAKSEIDGIDQKMVATATALGQRLANSIISAVQGGGNIGAAIGSTLGQAIGTAVGRSIGTAIGGTIGSVIGTGVMPVVGTMVGGWIGSFLGSQTDKNKVPDDVDKIRGIIDSGAFKQLRQEATDLGISMQGLFTGAALTNLATFQAELEHLVDKVAKVKALKEEIAALVEATTVNFDKMNAVVKEFGLDITKLGPAFQQAALDKEAQRIIDAMAVMEKGGANMSGVLEGMADEISKLVQDSIKFGGTIPENMKPWIQQLIDAGLLLDEQGNKITDMSQMKFGAPMKSEMAKLTEELEKLTEKLDELVKALTETLPNAITNIPDVTIGVDIDVDDSELNDLTLGGRTIPKLARGGIVSRPTLALIGEAGPEAVVPLSGRHAPAGNGGGVTFNLTLNDAVFDGYASEQRFAQRVFSAIASAGDLRGLQTAFSGA
mgnify:CR=1 FL=1